MVTPGLRPFDRPADMGEVVGGDGLPDLGAWHSLVDEAPGQSLSRHTVFNHPIRPPLGTVGYRSIHSSTRRLREADNRSAPVLGGYRST